MEKAAQTPTFGTAMLHRNDKRLSLTFIGAGCAFTKLNFQTNALVVCGDDHLLIDCGTRAPEALRRLDLSVTDIRNYLVTHSHADHVGGLEEVMLQYRYVAKRKPCLICPPAYAKKLWSESLKGGAAYNEKRAGMYLKFSDMWDSLACVPVHNADRDLCECVIGSIKVAMFRTMHIPDSALSWRSSALSYGVVINDSILYTSDTRYDPDMISFIMSRYDIKAVFHDCQLFTGGVHTSLEELKQLPAAIRGITRLMHYGDNASSYTPEQYGFLGFAEQGVSYVF